MPISDYLSYDALGLADLVRRGEVTPLELVNESIRRIEQLNPRLNAVDPPDVRCGPPCRRRSPP